MCLLKLRVRRDVTLGWMRQSTCDRCFGVWLCHVKSCLRFAGMLMSNKQEGKTISEHCRVSQTTRTKLVSSYNVQTEDKICLRKLVLRRFRTIVSLGVWQGFPEVKF